MASEVVKHRYLFPETDFNPISVGDWSMELLMEYFSTPVWQNFCGLVFSVHNGRKRSKPPMLRSLRCDMLICSEPDYGIGSARCQCKGLAPSSQFSGTSLVAFSSQVLYTAYKLKGWCYTRLASPVAVCIDIPRRYTRLAWLANRNRNPNPTNPSYGYSRVSIGLAVCIDTFKLKTLQL